MRKTQFIILILAGLTSFAGSFGVSLFLKKEKPAAPAQQTLPQEPKPVENTASIADSIRSFSDSGFDRIESGMSEQQLQNLIYDVRTLLKECDERRRTLDIEEERIQISQQSLQKDIEEFNNLRDKLNITLAEIRKKEESLKQSITEIDEIEKTNFQRLAGTYEKMDSAQAGRIMVSMANSDQVQDPVKILYYMNERMAGKLLSEIATLKPELASLLCTKLKLVKETE